MRRKKCPPVTCEDIHRQLLPLMRKYIIKTNSDGLERGFLSYRSPWDCKLKLTEKCIGDECSIRWRTPKPFYGNIDFHTHPSEHSATPSVMDSFATARRKQEFHCIGGGDPLYRIGLVKCYKARSQSDPWYKKLDQLLEKNEIGFRLKAMRFDRDIKPSCTWDLKE